MSPALAGFTGEPALVPGELRGYRQFRLYSGGLYPVAMDRMGPWSADTQRAACAKSIPHDAPDRDCQCGLYGWYHPSDATGLPGGVMAVVSASGRTILGDSGFRAAAGADRSRCPAAVGAAEPGGACARPLGPGQRLPPGAGCISTRRQMLRDHPPERLEALGINPRRNLTRRYARLAASLWIILIMLSYAWVLVPRPIMAGHLWRVVWIGVLVAIVLAYLGLAALARRRAGPRPGPPTASATSATGDRGCRVTADGVSARLAGSAPGDSADPRLGPAVVRWWVTRRRVTRGAPHRTGTYRGTGRARHRRRRPATTHRPANPARARFARTAVSSATVPATSAAWGPPARSATLGLTGFSTDGPPAPSECAATPGHAPARKALS